jgi:ribose 5-phosphate isomerase B
LALAAEIWYQATSFLMSWCVLVPMVSETIAIAADHAGVEMKTLLRGALEEAGLRVLDLGTDKAESVDYPDFADAVAKALAEGRAGRGVLICGTGIGMAMAANRHKGIRAAVCHDAVSARLARQHNDANVLALGARTTGPEVARDCLRVFLETKFDGGERHRRRIRKMG